ncbi:MAG TPA: hypothetical protein VMH40_12450 [Myxococcaceae bacterium]|nr:hypothetical protein [Myxococcaceae bacterium]
MRGPRSPVAKVVGCALGTVATWFLTIGLGLSPRRNLPATLGQVVFEVVWLGFPGVVVGAFWVARGSGGRFPLFTAAATAAALIWLAHGFDLQADPLAALTIVFAPLVAACVALVGMALTLGVQYLRRRAGRSDASP